MLSSLRRAAALGAVLALSGCAGSSGGDAPAPTASAGMSHAVPKRTLVLLDGSGSVPPDGWTGPMRYRWTQVAGTPVTLSDPSAATPTYLTPGVSGPLTFSLVVMAGGTSAPASVTHQVVNQPPVAVAGAELVVRSGWLSTLDAHGSWDADGDPLTVTWLQAGGPAVLLDTPAPGLARFTAPDDQVALSFLAVVSDGEASAEAPVSVRVLPPGANLPPLADAGPDLDVPRSSYVTLRGSGSDPDGFPVTFQWQQVGGPAVSLAGAFGQTQASFWAPGGTTDLEFQLTVSDGVESVSDRMLVHVRNLPPVVSGVAITPAQPRTADDLGVVASVTDPEGDAFTLAYAWKLNGAEVPGQSGATLPAALTTKGDVVSVTVTASDATGIGVATASTTILDSPPVLSVTLPAEIAFGEAATGQVLAVDPDGDPVVAGAFSLEYGPLGMAVSPEGVVTWTPSLPMFDRTLDVHFGLRMAGDPPGRSDRTVRVADPARPQAMRRAGLEIARSAEGMLARDLDGDGREELLVSGLSGVYELRAVNGGYGVAWMVPFATPLTSDPGYTSSAAVEAADADGDGRAEIFFGTQNLLIRLDGATRRESGRVALAATGDRWRSCAAADLEGDGAVELTCLISTGSYWYSADGRLVVLDAATLAVEFETATLPLGGSLAVGDVDEDAALEIVTSGGYVYDGATHLNQWAYTPGFGSFVRIGHPVAGGPAQIVGGTPLRGYSATLKSPLWEASGTGNVPFLLRDVDGDGADEVVSVGGYSASLTASRYVGGATPLSQLFAVNLGLYQSSTVALAAGDFDGDGEAELAWDDGGGSSGEDSMRVAGPISNAAALEWHNGDPSQLDGPMAGGALMRIGGGAERLAFLSPKTNSGYDGSRVVLLDPDSGRLSTSMEIGSNWSGSTGLAPADYDGDGVDELLVGSGAIYDGFFAAWDPATDTLPWKSSPLTGSSYSEGVVAVAAADLNADGFPDLVGLSTGGSIWIQDVRNQTLIWKSTSLGRATALQVADLDGDGRPEVVVLAGGRVVSYRWSAQAAVFLEAAAFSAPGALDLAVADCDGDGTPEVYVLEGPGSSWGTDSTVSRLDASLAPLGSFTLAQRASALFVEDLGGTRRNLAVAAVVPFDAYSSSGRNLVMALDPITGTEIWHSPDLFGPVTRGSATWFQRGGAWHLALGAGRSMYLTR